jgi:hypothetical protein
MEQKVICGIEGVGIYGVISIVIFFVFFTGAFLWVISLKKNYVQHMQDLPLDDSEKKPTDKNQTA